MADGSGPHGQIDAQIAAQGDTSSGSATGTLTTQITLADWHLLNQPILHLNILDPSVQFQFATDRTWQAQLGWGLLKREWPRFTNKLSFGVQQAVARQFGENSSQSAWVFNILQGQGQVDITKIQTSTLYIFAQTTFYASRQDDGNWRAGFQQTVGFGLQLEMLFRRSH
jgi:hypothetical protein